MSLTSLNDDVAAMKIKNIILKCKQEGRYYNSYCGEDSLDVSQMITHIRNAASHSGNKGIMLVADDNEEISDIFFMIRIPGIKSMNFA